MKRFFTFLPVCVLLFCVIWLLKPQQHHLKTHTALLPANTPVILQAAQVSKLISLGQWATQSLYRLIHEENDGDLLHLSSYIQAVMSNRRVLADILMPFSQALNSALDEPLRSSPVTLALLSPERETLSDQNTIYSVLSRNMVLLVDLPSSYRSLGKKSLQETFPPHLKKQFHSSTYQGQEMYSYPLSLLSDFSFLGDLQDKQVQVVLSVVDQIMMFSFDRRTLERCIDEKIAGVLGRDTGLAKNTSFTAVQLLADDWQDFFAYANIEQVIALWKRLAPRAKQETLQDLSKQAPDTAKSVVFWPDIQQGHVEQIAVFDLTRDPPLGQDTEKHMDTSQSLEMNTLLILSPRPHGNTKEKKGLEPLPGLATVHQKTGFYMYSASLLDMVNHLLSTSDGEEQGQPLLLKVVKSFFHYMRLHGKGEDALFGSGGFFVLRGNTNKTKTQSNGFPVAASGIELREPKQAKRFVDQAIQGLPTRSVPGADAQVISVAFVPGVLEPAFAFHQGYLLIADRAELIIDMLQEQKAYSAVPMLNFLKQRFAPQNILSEGYIQTKPFGEMLSRFYQLYGYLLEEFLGKKLSHLSQIVVDRLVPLLIQIDATIRATCQEQGEQIRLFFHIDIPDISVLQPPEMPQTK